MKIAEFKTEYSVYSLIKKKDWNNNNYNYQVMKHDINHRLPILITTIRRDGNKAKEIFLKIEGEKK